MNVARAGAALIQGAQKRHSSVGVVLPTILSIQNDAHEGGIRPVHRLTDAPKPHGEVFGGSYGIVALVMEADQIAERVVSENDPELMARLGHLIGTVHVAGISDVAAIVSTNKALSRAAQDFLVGGNPANAMLSQKREYALAYGSLRRPHPSRRLSKEALVL